MMDFALSAMVLAVVALLGGAAFLLRRGGARKQALLMLVLSGVIAMNVAIWIVPDRTGNSPATAAAPAR